MTTESEIIPGDIAPMRDVAPVPHEVGASGLDSDLEMLSSVQQLLVQQQMAASQQEQLQGKQEALQRQVAELHRMLKVQISVQGQLQLKVGSQAQLYNRLQEQVGTHDLQIQQLQQFHALVDGEQRGSDVAAQHGKAPQPSQSSAGTTVPVVGDLRCLENDPADKMLLMYPGLAAKSVPRAVGWNVGEQVAPSCTAGTSTTGVSSPGVGGASSSGSSGNGVNLTDPHVGVPTMTLEEAQRTIAREVSQSIRPGQFIDAVTERQLVTAARATGADARPSEKSGLGSVAMRRQNSDSCERPSCEGLTYEKSDLDSKSDSLVAGPPGPLSLLKQGITIGKVHLPEANSLPHPLCLRDVTPPSSPRPIPELGALGRRPSHSSTGARGKPHVSLMD